MSASHTLSGELVLVGRPKDSSRSFRLLAAEWLREPYGSINYADSSIFFEGGKFFESHMSCDLNGHYFTKTQLDWKAVLQAIKGGWYR